MTLNSNIRSVGPSTEFFCFYILGMPKHQIFIFHWNFGWQLKSTLRPLLERCECDIGGNISCVTIDHTKACHTEFTIVNYVNCSLIFFIEPPCPKERYLSPVLLSTPNRRGNILLMALPRPVQHQYYVQLGELDFIFVPYPYTVLSYHSGWSSLALFATLFCICIDRKNRRHFACSDVHINSVWIVCGLNVAWNHTFFESSLSLASLAGFYLPPTSRLHHPSSSLPFICEPIPSPLHSLLPRQAGRESELLNERHHAKPSGLVLRDKIGEDR